MPTHRVIFCLAVALFIGCFLLVLEHPNLQGDEPIHYDQIVRMIRGNHQLNPWITTLPVYHFFMARPGLLFNKIPRPSLVRFFTFCTGLLTIAVFRAADRRIDPTVSELKTFQFAFFPILFPMFFVIYTDVLSLLLVLLAYFCADRRNYFLSRVSATLAIAVRQNNIVWLLMVLVFILWRERDFRWLGYGWTFLLGLIGFAGFLILNHGPSVGDRSRHPITASSGNLFLFLFLFFLFFLPYQISAVPAIRRMLQGKKKILIGIVLFSFFI
jgi:alpha-1,2-glucosyltransferase